MKQKMTKQELKIFVEGYMKAYPMYKKQIWGFYCNALTEIEMGANEYSECYFAGCDVKEFINSKQY